MAKITKKKKQSNSRSARCGRAADAVREVVQTLRDAVANIEDLMNRTEDTKIFKLDPEMFKELPTEVEVGDFEELKDELQSWFDNLPESLQGGDTGSRLEEAVGNLESAIDTIGNVTFPDVPTGEITETELESFRDELSTAADELESGADEAEGTEFPGMYGR